MEKNYLLDYTHEELEDLFHKIKLGNVLNNEQYQKLIEEIGLDNISTFSGSYEDLIDKPNYEDFMDSEFIKMKSELEETLQRTKAQISVLEELLLYKDKEFRDLFATKSLLDSRIKNLKGSMDNRCDDIEFTIGLDHESILKKIESKADLAHKHQLTDLELFNEKMDTKANVSHRHENEHEHTNKDVLDNIDHDKYQYWDLKVNYDELPQRLSELFNDEDFVDINYVESYVINAIEHLNIKRYLLKEDYDFDQANKAEKHHLHDIIEIKNLETLLDDKIDKSDSESLVSNELIAVLEKLKVLVTKTNDRPSNVIVGQYYYDPVINRPIWWNGEKWTDAFGNEV